MRAVRAILTLLLLGSTDVDAKEIRPVGKHAKADAEEEVRYPRWSWGGLVSAFGGYNDNISISRFARPGTKRGSGTTDLAADIGPKLALREGLSTFLSYSFAHGFTYSDHDLDTQAHALQLGLGWQGERVYASGSYSAALSFLLPKDVFYSIDHVVAGSLEVLIGGPLWAGATATYTFYGVRADEYAYLRGHDVELDVFPELYLREGLLTLTAGYKLELARLGEVTDQVALPAGTTQVKSTLSYNAHYFALWAMLWPINSLYFTLSAKVGRKLYPDAVVTGPGPGPGPGAQQGRGRGDTVFKGDLFGSWTFYRGLALEASVGYERSSSSLNTRFITGSYTNFTCSGGLAWRF